MPPKKDLSEKLAEMRMRSKVADEKAAAKEKAAAAVAKEKTAATKAREEKAATTIQRAFRKKKERETPAGQMKEKARSFIRHVESGSRRKEASSYHPDGAVAQMEHNFSMAERAIEVMDRNRDRMPVFKWKDHSEFWAREKPSIVSATEPFLAKHFNYYKHFTNHKRRIPEANEPNFIRDVMDRGYFVQDPNVGIKIKYMATEPSDLELMKERLPRVGAEGVPFMPMRTGGVVPKSKKK